MTNATRSVAVVATRLPITDRRALSQAWFSALHVAQPDPVTARPHGSPARVTASPRTVDAAAAEAPAGGVRRTIPPATPSRASSSAMPAAIERRIPPTPLARRVQHALARTLTTRNASAAADGRSASAIAVNLGDGRVQLLVRSDAGATRVVALCATHARERVERALAAARFGLAAAGIPLDVEIATRERGRA